MLTDLEYFPGPPQARNKQWPCASGECPGSASTPHRLRIPGERPGRASTGLPSVDRMAESSTTRTRQLPRSWPIQVRLGATGVTTGLALAGSTHLLRAPGASAVAVVAAATVLSFTPAILRWVAGQRRWRPFALGLCAGWAPLAIAFVTLR